MAFPQLSIEPMNINADYSQKVVINHHDLPWTASPELGEEIFVLEGVFSDETGHYPKGSWIRSPHMSLHKPFSQEGCIIFVKTGHLLDE
jgi:hypothetical protein